VKTPRKFTVVIERDEEDYFVATVPALRGCHTQAKNLDTLMKRVREVIQLCLEDNQAAPSLEIPTSSNRFLYDSPSSLEGQRKSYVFPKK
jgi:predicted RNase H-like HicB family nuclease